MTTKSILNPHSGKLQIINDIDRNGLSIYFGSQTLVDDEEITIATSQAGFGKVNIGNDQEFSNFSFSTTTVTGWQDTTNVAYADTDGNLCIYYDGAALKIKNRLGTSLTVRYSIFAS